MAALDEIGLGDAVRDAGGRVTAGAMRWHDGSWLRQPSPERIVNALGEPLVVVRRSVLMKLLADALEGGTIASGAAATDLVATAYGVRITLSDNTTRDADAVVGADGVGSMVARHLNGTLNRHYAGYTAWRGVAAHDLDPASGRRNHGHRNRVRPRSARARPHLLVRHRTRSRGPHLARG